MNKRIKFIYLNRNLTKFILEDRYYYLIGRIQAQLFWLWNDMTESDKDYIKKWYNY